MGIKEKREYYQKQELKDKVIVSHLKDDESLILYGARSVNMQLPDYLRKRTEDWDIYSTGDPQKEAKELEHLLDKRYGEDYFAVKPAKFPNTFKVYSKVTNTGVADIQLRKGNVPNKKIAGINVATLDYQKERIDASLKDPESEFRHEKDKEALQRIQIFEKFNKHQKRIMVNKARKQYGNNWKYYYKDLNNNVDWGKLNFELD